MRSISAYPAIEGAHDSGTPLRCLFALFWAFVLLRFILNANILDQVVNYSADGGSIVAKIHPSTYGIVAVLIATLLSTRIELSSWELSALRSLIVLVAVMGMIAVFALLLGHSGSTGYLVDSYLAGCVAAALMLFFPPMWREWLGTTLLIFITASAGVGLVEFVVQARFLPYPLQEASFRPTGLSQHPLVLGLFDAVGINFVAASRWKAVAKAGAIIIMLLSAFAAGARIAAIVAAVSTLSVIALHEWPSTSPQTRFRVKTLLFLATGLAVLPVLTVFASVGLLDRFQNGLFDESAMARVNIYRLFEIVHLNDILFGTDISNIRRLAFEHFDLDYIESSLVIFVFQFGLFGTIVFLVSLARTFAVLLSRASRHIVIGTAAFFIVAGGNNSLATKTPIILMIMLLIIAFHGADRTAQTLRADAKTQGA